MAPREGRPPAGVTVALAGGLAVRRDDRPVPDPEIGSRKARQLLRLLAVERGHAVTVDAITAVLWPDAAPKSPADNVATLVSRLRATLGAHAVATVADGYRLGPGVRVDLDVAAERVKEAERRLAAGEAGLARAAAMAALELVDQTPADDRDWARAARDEALGLLAGARRTAAEAELALGDAAAAVRLADAAIAADPYDERAHRLAMRGYAATGQAGRALAMYEKLRTRLADEFGVDPAPETRDVHLAILREDGPAPAPPAGRPARSTLVGRDEEVAALTGRWTAAAAGRPGLVLVAGEAGIGKTRLAQVLVDLATRTGGTVLSARCYETERSLFLQPVAEALGQHASRTGPDALRRLVGDGAAPLTALVPEIAATLGRVEQGGDADTQRQRAYRAVTDYLGRLADAPVLLLLDDLHHAGLATVELMHYLIRHAGDARLLVLATVRAEEGAAALGALADVADVVELGPLTADAVARLAADAGQAAHAPGITARTGGHPLFVVETLRGLAAGEAGIPESLREAVLARVRRAGPPIERLLRAGSVLGATLDPEMLGRLLDIGPARAAELCESALDARLLVVADRAYEFANDLIREVLYASMPEPTRLAHHRAAAGLLESRPEALAGHAAAAGDLARAARAWLLAGEEAERHFAPADAQVLLSRAIDAAERAGDRDVIGRALLARGQARDVMAHSAGALRDLEAAVEVAHAEGDRRLEMLAHVELGRDAMVALGQPLDLCVLSLNRGLRLASALGDRFTEARVLARLGIIWCSRLDFIAALDYGRRAVDAAEPSGDEEMLAAGLDGLKTAYAYLGDIASLTEVVARLDPILRARRDLFRLQWLVQENAFGAVAAGDWDTATALSVEAWEINRRSGWASCEGWFAGNLGWVRRLAGDLDGALEYGRRAVELTAGGRHGWWRAATSGQLGVTLLARGEREEAAELLAGALGFAPRTGAEAYRLRCLAPLAEATGHPDRLAEADAMLAAIVTPAAHAWLPGLDAYLSVARAWRAAGEPARAEAVLAPLRAGAARAGWAWLADTKE